MTLLLITGSADGTADRIVERYGSGVFRLNYDLLYDYDIAFTEDRWSIVSPSGLKLTSDDVTACCWWKAFHYWNPNVAKYPAAENRYLCRDIYGWCALHRTVIGNPPDFHNRLGKMTILGVAKRYFNVPKTLATVNSSGVETLQGSRVVAKSLASETTEEKKVLHTTEVELERLHPKNVWYLQQVVESRWDITVFYCNGKCFGFRRDRSDLEGLDWRVAQSFDYSQQEWFPIELETAFIDKLKNISSDLGLEFGRYDFMENADGQLLFLEVNANGQWVFLDIKDEYGLLDSVVAWLKGTSSTNVSSKRQEEPSHRETTDMEVLLTAQLSTASFLSTEASHH